MRPWDRMRRQAERSRFYCRRENSVVGGCPLAGGPCRCPLRPECPARDASRGSTIGPGADS